MTNQALRRATSKNSQRKTQAQTAPRLLEPQTDSKQKPEPLETRKRQHCKICADGNLPTGMHTCFYCHLPVHIIDESCSIPYAADENMDGQGFNKRVCIDCIDRHHRSRNYDETSRTENWMGVSDKALQVATHAPAHKAIKKNEKNTKYMQAKPAFKHVDSQNTRVLCKNDIMLVTSTKPSTKTIAGKSVTLENTSTFASHCGGRSFPILRSH